MSAVGGETSPSVGRRSASMADIVVVVVLERHIAAADNDQTGLLEFCPRLFDFFGRTVDREVEFLNVDIRRIEPLGHYDGGVPAELAE